MKIQIKARVTDAILFECEIDSDEKRPLRAALQKAVARGADLYGADLRGADLSGANLYGADLRGANLYGADLRGANLDGANLRGANLYGADLRGANLYGADLRGADLDGADLDGADLRGAYLDGADLYGAYLRGADLDGADLRGADLYGADLRGANLYETPLATPEQAIANLDRVREIIIDDPKRLHMGHWHDDESNWIEHTCAEEAMCGTTHCLAGWLQVCSEDEKVRKLEPSIAGIICAPIAAKMFFRGETEVMGWLKDRKYVAESAEREARAKKEPA